MPDAAIPLAEITAARGRIAPLLRRTPVIAAQPARQPADPALSKPKPSSVPRRRMARPPNNHGLAARR